MNGSTELAAQRMAARMREAEAYRLAKATKAPRAPREHRAAGALMRALTRPLARRHAPRATRPAIAG